MTNLLPCLIYDFNQLFQFNWNILFKHILDALKLNFKSINSKIIDLNFFVTIPSALVLIFLYKQNGLNFEDDPVYRIPN